VTPLGARSAGVALAALLVACLPPRSPELDLSGYAPFGSFGERSRVLAPAPGVTATMVAPARLDARTRVDLILYALPNGNTTAQTMGRRLTPGLDWHYDIQHIGAQTRALRARGLSQAVVVYLEADTKSWPEWRRARGYDRANAEIVAIVDRLRAEFANAARVSVTLAGHSGGGSFMFGFIEGRDSLPDWLNRIAFLDANYNFEPRHGEKIAVWLRGGPPRSLAVLAYDDREITLDGRKVVSDSGGTWRATERMIRYLTVPFALAVDTLGEFRRHRGPRIELLVHPNPANRILHTEMVGEMNGYMHALLLHRDGYDDRATVLAPVRAYTRWIEPD
jgi:hypothetical protein